VTAGETPLEALAGGNLAAVLGLHPGDRLPIQIAGREASLSITGILRSGGEEDDALLLPIEAVWDLSGQPGRLSRVFVRALTTPESAVYERLGAGPKDLPPEEFERWTCTPFPSSIAYELERAVPGSEARVIRRVADSEGTILRRISGLMAAIAVLAAFGSALAVTSALSTSVLERRSEIGLLKAMGAGNPRVVALFLAEAVLFGVAGGLLGAGLGALMARFISLSVFGTPVAIRPLAIPLAIAVALLITIAGFVAPARRILKFRPYEVLRGL
jgi:putative ABC transport system permease protein